MHDIEKFCLGLLGFILIIAFIGMIYQNNEDEKNFQEWNNGKCSCGNAWRFFDVELWGNYSSSTYFYICDNCKNLLEIKTYMKEIM